jgi:glucitol operon activator protein
MILKNKGRFVLNQWAYLLGAFGALWFVQIVGTALQMRHYRRVLAQITRTWQDGFVGVGNARAKLGKGVIMILVASPDGSIREALAMRGRTVFATFKPVPELQNGNLRELRSGNLPAGLSHGDREALERAIAQIDQASQRRAAPSTHDVDTGAQAPLPG